VFLQIHPLQGEKLPEFFLVDFHFGGFICNYSLLYGIALSGSKKII
jgi:hypothetical protein